MAGDSTSLRQKVHGLYNLIGDRRLYVNTDCDVFMGPHESIQAGRANQHRYTLLKDGEEPGSPRPQAYSSPLLFETLTSLVNGTMLLTGTYGIGKTTGAEFAGHFFTGQPLEEIWEATIQGYAQQTVEEMVGSYDVAKLMKGEKEVLPSKFILSQVKIIDEANRLGPDNWNALLRLIDQGFAVYGGQVLRPKVKGPLFATMNYRDAGTYENEKPGIDRFDVAAIVTSPPSWDLSEILKRSDSKLNGGLKELMEIPPELALSLKDRDDIKKQISAMPLAEGVDMYLNFLMASLRYSESASGDICRMTKGTAQNRDAPIGSSTHFGEHSSAFTRNELSVRTAQALRRYGRALSWFAGQDEVTHETIDTLFPYATFHKLEPTGKAIQAWKNADGDGISFSKNLLEKIGGEWTALMGEKAALQHYSNTIDAIEAWKRLAADPMARSYSEGELARRFPEAAISIDGSPAKRICSREELRRITEGAISEIAKVDLPFASTAMAEQVQVAYNEFVMGKPPLPPDEEEG